MRLSIILSVFISVVASEYVCSSENGRASELNISPIRESYCAPKHFNDFLLAFSDNVDIQRRFTRFPLQKLFVRMDAEPEPRPEEVLLKQPEVSFPIYPSSKKIEKLSLIVEISQDKETVEVSIKKEDADYQMSFFFEFSNCWHLVRVEDWSL